MVIDETSKTLAKTLEKKFGDKLIKCDTSIGHAVVHIRRESVLDFFKECKSDESLSFEMLLSVTAVDYMDSRDERYEVVYHLLSIKHKLRLRVKVIVPETDAKIDSVVSLWKSAEFMERETWDMYGIDFTGHGDLRRILMYDEFKGHPLRKDYPIQGKQPRIQLRSPEVRNTAVDMQRSELVNINSKKDKPENSALSARESVV